MALPDPQRPLAELNTITECAEFFRVHPRTIKRWVATRQLRARRFPSGVVRIARVDVEELLRASSTKPPTDDTAELGRR